MPITLLSDIKLSGQSCIDFFDEADEHIVGAYVFPCKDLKVNQPLFSDGFPSIIFMPDKTDEVCLSKGDKTIMLKSVWVCGGVIKDTKWNIPDGLENVLVLRFTPGSFYSIFDISPARFVSVPVCSFEDLVDEKWQRVIDEMYGENNWFERASMIKMALLSSKKKSYLPSLLEAAMAYVDREKGNTTVSDLLQSIGAKVNRKWLQRNFIKYIGLSPKKYISLQRFIYTYGRYDLDKPSDLPGIAVLSGYYDYNHFLKDFKQYMGTAPSRYSWTNGHCKAGS